MTNPRIRQAITSVPVDDFSRGANLNRHTGVDVAALQQAHMVAGNVPVVPDRESLRSSTKIAGAPASTITPKANEHFFVKTQPPAAPPSFNDQAAKVQQVIQTHAPEIAAATKTSVGASAAASPVRGQASVGSQTQVSEGAGQQTIHMNNPPEAQKTVQSGPPAGKQQTPPVAKVGPPEQVSSSSSAKQNPGSDNKNSQGFQKFGPPADKQQAAPPVAKMGPPESGSASGQHQSPAPVAKMGPPEQDSSGSSAKQNSGSDNKNSQGWQKLGPPTGSSRLPESGIANSQQQPPVTVAKLGPPEQQQDKSGDSSKQKPGSIQGWQKFGSPAGGQSTAPADNGSSGHQQPQPPSQQQTQQQPGANVPQNHNGWQKFPSSSGPGTSSPNQTSGSQKPPLDLKNPIVTPRPSGDDTRQIHTPPTPTPPIETNHGSMGGRDVRMPPPSPVPHIEPRMSPPAPAPRIEPRMSPPTPAPHSEPSHSGGGGDHSGGGGSHSSGSSGGSSSHSNNSSSDSKSSKGPH